MHSHLFVASHSSLLASLTPTQKIAFKIDKGFAEEKKSKNEDVGLARGFHLANK